MSRLRRAVEPRAAENTHELAPSGRRLHGNGVEGRAGRAVGVPVASACRARPHRTRRRGRRRARRGRTAAERDLRVAPKGVRPAVAQDQRQNGPGRRGDPDVHEVDLQATHPDAEAGEPGERRLLRRPLEPLRPVGDELAEVTDVGPERDQLIRRPLGAVRLQRVGTQPRARRSSSAAGAACGVNGSGRGSAAADGASGMRRILRAGERHLREDAHRVGGAGGRAGGGHRQRACTVTSCEVPRRRPAPQPAYRRVTQRRHRTRYWGGTP